jgi:hypothetical protein
MELYFKTNKSIHELAIVIRAKLNIALNNKTSYQIEQSRYSDNFGGDYYIFEVFGFIISLIKNHGEVKINKESIYNYYLLIETENEASQGLLLRIGNYLESLFLAENYDVKTGNYLH